MGLLSCCHADLHAAAIIPMRSIGTVSHLMSTARAGPYASEHSLTDRSLTVRQLVVMLMPPCPHCISSPLLLSCLCPCIRCSRQNLSALQMRHGTLVHRRRCCKACRSWARIPRPCRATAGAAIAAGAAWGALMGPSRTVLPPSWLTLLLLGLSFCQVGASASACQRCRVVCRQ